MKKLPAVFCALALAACAHPRPLSGGGGEPLQHHFRVVGLGADGRSLVEERESLTAPSGDRVRYHLSAPDGTVTVLGERRCESAAQCETSLPAELTKHGLEVVDRFRLSDQPLPLAQMVPFEGLGALELLVESIPGPQAPRGPALKVRHPGGAEALLWHLPSTEATRAQLYVAGSWLFVELELTGVPQRLVRATSLRSTAALLLDAEAVAALKGGRLSNAEARLRTALTLEPSRASLHYNLASALARQARPDEALVALTEALRLDPRLLPGRARTDPSFDSLRGREDFRKLVATKGMNATP